MSLTPPQLDELKLISDALSQRFPNNGNDQWWAAIRIQNAGLGPDGVGGTPVFLATLTDLVLTQDQIQTRQQRYGSLSTGFREAILQAVPSGGGGALLSAVGPETAQNLVSNTGVPLTGLSIDLEDATVYALEFFCGISQTSTGPDFASIFEFTGTFSSAGIGGVGQQGTLGPSNNVFRGDLTGEQTIPLAANAFNWIKTFGRIATSSAGTLTVSGRQLNTDAGNPTIIQAGSSYLTATPIG